MTSSAPDPRLAAEVIEALPLPVLAVDGALRVLHANAAARAVLSAGAGPSLGDALGCAEAGATTCGAGGRCSGCSVGAAVTRALAGERVRARGFLLRVDARGEPADLHLLVGAAPLDRDGARGAVLVLQDVDRILLDPSIVRVCSGCGRVEDDEGEWHPLHRYLEDRLGLANEELCRSCVWRAGR